METNINQAAGVAMFALQQANRQPQALLRLLAQIPLSGAAPASGESALQTTRPDGIGGRIDKIV